jgi:hypothetical protein
MKEEQIIDPQPRLLLRGELKQEFLLKTSNRGGFEIYVVTSKQCPSVMKELGRLREISFRHIKAGTGKSADIDEFDPYFEQLVIWDPKKHEIAGGYRIQTLLELRNSATNKESFSPLTKYFNLSKRFMEEYLPYTAEFGRAFVQPDYFFICSKVCILFPQCFGTIFFGKDQFPCCQFHFFPCFFSIEIISYYRQSCLRKMISNLM